MKLKSLMMKILLGLAAFVAMVGMACAQVEVNTADQSALDGIKGIGPKLSKVILDERKKGGDFKSWDDFEKRVKGVGAKSTDKLSKAGLLVGGKAKPNAEAVAAPTAPTAPR